MKYLLIFAVLFALLALIYWRLRPYIATLRRILGIMRDLRGVGTSERSETLRPSSRPGDRLVRCGSCNTWIPASRAVKPGASRTYYCSHDCLEVAADKQTGRRRAEG